MKRRKKRNFNKLDWYLIFCGVFFTVFVVVMIVTFYIKDAVPDALVDLVRWGITGEVTGCAIVKALNIKKEEEP